MHQPGPALAPRPECDECPVWEAALLAWGRNNVWDYRYVKT
jgi:hypothetical protein